MRWCLFFGVDVGVSWASPTVYSRAREIQDVISGVPRLVSRRLIGFGPGCGLA